MGSVKRPRAPKRTLSLIEICRWELDRLQKIAAEYRAFCLQSREFLATAREQYKPVDGIELRKSTDVCAFIKPIPDLQTRRDRAEETRSFAENVRDPRVKKLLLEIAASYDKISNGQAQ